MTIPLQSTFGGFTVEAHIDGKAVHLVLDTGASCTVLSPETARKIGLEAKEAGVSLTSAAGGQVSSQRALTRRISLGDAWTENEPVMVCEIFPGVDGLLGVSTLVDWDVRIDPSTNQLTLFAGGNAPPLEGETTLALSRGLLNPEASASNPQGFRMVNLRVPVRVGNHELTAIPDTGNGGGIFQLSSALMEKFAPEAMKEARPGLVSGMTLSGNVVSRQANAPRVCFWP